MILKSYFNGRYAKPVAHDADALLQHAREEPHLALLLEDLYIAARGYGLARHEGLAEAPAERVAIGRAPAVTVPVHAHAPKARFINPLALLYGGITVVGGVGVALVRPLGPQRHIAHVLDRYADRYRVAKHHLLG